MTTSRREPAANPIVLYDGVCALCNRFVTFVLARDRAAAFRFASLQSEYSRTTLVRHGRNPRELTTLVLVLDPGLPTERLFDKSSAALEVLKRLPGGWRGLGHVITLAPAPVRDWLYGLVARTRYRTFGKYDVCPVPASAVRDRFLD